MAIDLMTAFDGLVVPTRADPANFPARGDDMMSRFPTWQQQMNIITPQINATAIASAAAQVAAEAARDTANGYAVAAAASAAAAAASANVTKWVAGTNYAQGVQTWSPSDFATYRAKVALNPSNTDPATDTANWAPALERPFSAVEVLSISADTSLTATSKNVVRVASTVRHSSLLLANATTLAGRNGAFAFKNIGTFAIPLRDQSGALLAVIPANSSAWCVLEDSGTSAGNWFVMCPDGKPGNVTGVATINAGVSGWQDVQAIPGVANKALLAYIAGGSLTVRIATLNGDGTVSLGAALTVGSANIGWGEMIACCDSTKAIAAAGGLSGPTYNLYSLTLNTGTNTVTSSGGVDTGVDPAEYYDATPVVLDTTRVAWSVPAASPKSRLAIATHGGAGNPTFTLNDISTAVGDDRNNTLVGVGGGQILAAGNVAAVFYNTSGNTISQQSTLAASGLFQVGSGSAFASWLRGFNVAANKAVFVNGAAPVTGGTPPSKEKQLGLGWSGTTLAADYSGSASFNTPLYDGPQVGYVNHFVVGSAFCMAGASGAYGAPVLRVMRYSGDLLHEVAFGSPENMPMVSAPATSNKTCMRAAAVSGSKCIAVASNRSGFPIVFGLEIIKV